MAIDDLEIFDVARDAFVAVRAERDKLRAEVTRLHTLVCDLWNMVADEQRCDPDRGHHMDKGIRARAIGQVFWEFACDGCGREVLIPRRLDEAKPKGIGCLWCAPPGGRIDR